VITQHETLRDVLALVGGGIAELDDEPQMSQAVCAVMDDLDQTATEQVATAFLGVTISLVQRLARLTDTTPEAYWGQIAGRVSARLAEVENQA
jgi:hypothetical protein